MPELHDLKDRWDKIATEPHKDVMRNLLIEHINEYAEDLTHQDMDHDTTQFVRGQIDALRDLSLFLGLADIKRVYTKAPIRNVMTHRGNEG